MLSRDADAIYWMFRYVERAENVARFLDVNYNLTLGAPRQVADQWAPLVQTTGDDELFEQLYGDPTREHVVRFLAFDDRNQNSIWSCVRAARENARTVREVISTPMWEALNKFYHLVRVSREHPPREYPYDFCTHVKQASHVLIGVADATMSHGEAWHFGRVGQLLERADKTSRIVDVQYFLLLPNPDDVGTSLDVVRWSALLKSASALEMYRREHGRIEPRKVADFLILNRHFPRSMRFGVVNALDSVREITGSARATFTNRVEQLLGRLRSELDYASINDIITRGVHEFVDDFQRRLNEIGLSVQQEFFKTWQPSPETIGDARRQTAALAAGADRSSAG